ncbi:bone morphogenetic protein receptor type-2-like [Melanotaenia boesemani]|uniref:bone morphogenetic protein receptor type-2-like n=1 Tax=Melanotaenia boesemani TaxID=1250792 RepID=UPI001C05DD97|nr:bone morphogenetic protein receptor type-2-like [Melanotaenia boesemani]
MLWWQLVLAVESLFTCISQQSSIPKRKCVYQVPHERNHEFIDAGIVSGSMHLCENTDCCLGVYMIKNGQRKVDILACNIVQKSCPDATCTEQSLGKNVLISCVCNTDFCNSNITWTPESKQSPSTDSYFADKTMKTAVVVILLLTGVIIIAITWTSIHNDNQDGEENQPSSCHDYNIQPLHSCQSQTSENDISGIELLQVVSQGHFASVFQGKYKGSEVAVKVFTAGWKQKFTTEKDIYELLKMKHSGIIRFLGTGRKPDDNSCFIVLEYAEYGSLHSFLCKHTTSWMQSLKLCQSLSQGLSYLHSDLHSNDAYKPPVAHRDLSSNNVLVKTDGTCALCDFGCSTILHSCSGPTNMTVRHSGGNNNQGQDQLGTLNYMPPEILEGSVNLNSSFFLMQGDIYALSLVLWEIWMRCSDLFKGGIVPQHMLPYELELEANVTQERLIFHVSEENNRPSIPQYWHLLPQGSVLKEILTDCWDHDADARLTAHCVAERLLSLKPSYSP